MGEHAADDGGLLRRGRRRRRGRSPCSRSTPRSACPTPSPGGSPATPRTCWSRRGPWPACSTRRAAPGTSSRSPRTLARAAWAWFTEIERAGGLAAALDSGLVGERIAAAWEARSKRLATRADAITGVSEFPNLAEKLPERDPRPHSRCPRAGCRGCGRRRRSRSSATRPTPLRSRRGPAPGRLPGHARPGRPAHRPGGLRGQPVPGAGGLGTPSGDGAARPRRRRDGGRLHLRHRRGLRRARPPSWLPSCGPPARPSVWLAGKPSLGYAAGVDGYVFAGCDALAVLHTVLEQLGVKA